ncbi:hypothetical protein SBRCBS47491_008056 [Sporothrix bragantina]|uniref:Uncharacterized protein n=1 Tax=Sporothrix bragantina TaxID=671064 RepID=A0ABP0CJL6_9PEZI
MSSSRSASSRRRQAGPLASVNTGAMDIDQPAPLTAGSILGHMSHMSIYNMAPVADMEDDSVTDMTQSFHAPVTFSLPFRMVPVARMEPDASRIPVAHMAADMNDCAIAEDGDGEVTCLTDTEMIELFGPHPPNESTSSSSSSSSSIRSASRTCRKAPAPLGLMPTTNNRYNKPRPSSIIYPSPKTGFTGSHIPYTADTERVRRPSRSTSAAVKASGNVFDNGKGFYPPCSFSSSPAPSPVSSTRGRAATRTAAISTAGAGPSTNSATRSRSRSQSQSRGRNGRRPSIYEMFARPGATNPYYTGSNSPSVMTAPDRDTMMMPPPRRPSGARRPSVSFRHGPSA